VGGLKVDPERRILWAVSFVSQPWAKDTAEEVGWSAVFKYDLRTGKLLKRGGRRADESAREGLWRIAAPMPGKVIKFSVAEGDKVRKNQTLAVVEAMKMENELKSPGDGTVKKIYASAGDMVDTSKPLLEIESG